MKRLLLIIPITVAIGFGPSAVEAQVSTDPSNCSPATVGPLQAARHWAGFGSCEVTLTNVSSVSGDGEVFAGVIDGSHMHSSVGVTLTDKDTGELLGSCSDVQATPLEDVEPNISNLLSGGAQCSFSATIADGPRDVTAVCTVTGTLGGSFDCSLRQ